MRLGCPPYHGSMSMGNHRVLNIFISVYRLRKTSTHDCEPIHSSIREHNPGCKCSIYLNYGALRSASNEIDYLNSDWGPFSHESIYGGDLFCPFVRGSSITTCQVKPELSL